MLRLFYRLVQPFLVTGKSKAENLQRRILVPQAGEQADRILVAEQVEPRCLDVEGVAYDGLSTSPHVTLPDGVPSQQIFTLH